MDAPGKFGEHGRLLECSPNFPSASTAKSTSKFFYNIAAKNACFSINYTILVRRDTITNASVYWLITNPPQWCSLSENSFCKTEKENLLIYSLTINEN